MKKLGYSLPVLAGALVGISMSLVSTQVTTKFWIWEGCLVILLPVIIGTIVKRIK